MIEINVHSSLIDDGDNHYQHNFGSSAKSTCKGWEIIYLEPWKKEQAISLIAHNYY